MMNILLNKRPVLTFDNIVTLDEINTNVCSLGLDISDYYLLYNGKIVNIDTAIQHGHMEIVLRTFGGKGGFGSMLRAIGAQIEKTTNREACRDLSGRRLRDINEEKRLKNWITQQAQREKEAIERKQKKLEKLCEEPKHVFVDDEYDHERSQLLEVVESAVAQGLKASCSNVNLKRKKSGTEKCKKKPKLWHDSDLDDLSSSGDEELDVDDVKTSTESSESNSSDRVSSDNSLSVENKSNSEEINSKENCDNDNELKAAEEKQTEKCPNVLQSTV